MTASQVAAPGKAAGVANRHPHDPRAHEAHPHGPHPRQAMLLEPGRLELREVSPPHPGAGAILVEIKCALSCGTDLKTFRRGHPMWKLPTPSGMNFGCGGRSGRGRRTVQAWRCDHGGADRALRRLLLLRSRPGKSLPAGDGPDGDGGVRRLSFAAAAHRCAQHLRKPPSLAFEEAALLEPLACVVHAQEMARPRKARDRTDNRRGCRSA